MSNTKHIRKEITDYNEMHGNICDIGINVCNNVRNLIKPILFHLFHGQRNSTIINNVLILH
jgi:hypothetical protein